VRVNTGIVSKFITGLWKQTDELSGKEQKSQGSFSLDWVKRFHPLSDSPSLCQHDASVIPVNRLSLHKYGNEGAGSQYPKVSKHHEIMYISIPWIILLWRYSIYYSYWNFFLERHKKFSFIKHTIFQNDELIKIFINRIYNCIEISSTI